MCLLRYRLVAVVEIPLHVSSVGYYILAHWQYSHVAEEPVDDGRCHRLVNALYLALPSHECEQAEGEVVDGMVDLRVSLYLKTSLIESAPVELVPHAFHCLHTLGCLNDGITAGLAPYVVLIRYGVAMRMYHQAAVIAASLKLINEGCQRLPYAYAAVNSHDDGCLGIAEGVKAHLIALTERR